MNPPAIVDAHVHLWNPAQFPYPWLNDLPALNRAFLPADFSAAIDGLPVRKVIFVESGCEPDRSLAEVGWICRLAQTEPHLRGIIAHASLEQGAAVRNHLTELARRPLVRGIRRNLQSEADPAFCLRPDFITGVEQLAAFDFTFDVCVRRAQLRGVAGLARCLPQITFVLDHLGKPDVRGRLFEPWAADLEILASLPNVVCKISGLATEADCQKWQPDDLTTYFAHALKCFGEDRLLFGGDWPVATLATSYQRWFETVREFFSTAGESVLAKLFQTNAERIYHV